MANSDTAAHRHLPRWARLYYWACQRLYHELAWGYDAASWLVSGGRWARWRRLALNYTRGPRVLDVGFGTGALLLEMTRRGLDAWGVELSPAMQRVAARKLRRHALAPPRVQARTQALPFADGAFDTVISTFPADYILHPQTLAEAARVLRRPAGRLVVVGLGVYWRRRLPDAPPSDRRIARFTELANAAGLAVTCAVHHDPPVQIPVCVARWPADA